jgi:glycosyltransferase involved in cell wall biosynthesis
MYCLNNFITFAGRLNADQICKLLSTTHVLVLPSFIENSSNALGEAQMIGVPCVASSNCGGILSIIKEHINGVFFYKGDGFDLSQKIRKIFLNDDLAKLLSKNSRDFGKDFHNKENIKNQYSNIYKSIINHESTT